jgi:hypothetical protein
MRVGDLVKRKDRRHWGNWGLGIIVGRVILSHHAKHYRQVYWFGLKETRINSIFHLDLVSEIK